MLSVDLLSVLISVLVDVLGVLVCVLLVDVLVYYFFVLQEEFDDDDEWNPCKAAGVCLMLLATCCEDDIVGFVLPFVTEHIKNTDWKFRDAAVMAFGRLILRKNWFTSCFKLSIVFELLSCTVFD